MCASSDISILLLLLSLSLSSDKAKTELLYPPPPPITVALATPLGGEVRGGESHQLLLACSSESDGEMLVLLEKGKKLGPLTPKGECGWC
jgi:hypothetical protein